MQIIAHRTFLSVLALCSAITAAHAQSNEAFLNEHRKLLASEGIVSASDVTAAIKKVRAFSAKHHVGEGVEAVFDSGSFHYTMMWFPGKGTKARPQTLSVWVRPVGTHGQATLQTFSDTAGDGIIDYGIAGKAGDKPGVRMHFDSGADGSTATAKTYKTFWQLQYAKAIAAALKSLK